MFLQFRDMKLELITVHFVLRFFTSGRLVSSQKERHHCAQEPSVYHPGEYYISPTTIPQRSVYACQSRILGVASGTGYGAGVGEDGGNLCSFPAHTLF